jgi:membrane protein
VAGIVDRVDAFQRRHPVLGFPLAVVYKFFDDQGPYLAAILTYYAFIAIFPVLLIASSVLGFFLQGNEELQATLLDSALRQFPIVGTQLGQPEGLQGSTSAVVIGALAALYGMLGLGQAAQNALNVAWAVPRNSRFNPVIGRLRGLVTLGFAGLVVLVVTALSGVATNLGSLGVDIAPLLRWVGTLVSVTVTALVLSLMMRFTTSRRPSLRTSLPGGFVIAVLWHGLQLLGGEYVRRVIATASDMNAVFALVLGLFALLFLASVMAVLGLEVNVVLNRTLYPRALLTPFTDAVHLTEADRRAYRSYAQAQRHKGFERVEVSFDGQPDGHPQGHPDGHPQGHPDGHPQGHPEGRADGRPQARTDAPDHAESA